ncbi:hypothetical protein [Pseudomonas sp. S2_E02]
MLFKPEFDSVFQVGATCTFSAVSSLSLKGDEGEREPIFVLFKPEFDSVFQVGATCTFSAVSSLYLWERVRVRAVVWVIGNFGSEEEV